MKYLAFLILSMSLLTMACVDREFDAPPVEDLVDPNIAADQIMTVAEVLDLRSGDFTQVGQDKYLKVVVIADDESGNFYKSLVVQDETGGLTILLDDVELWNKYYVGKRLFIHLERIWVGDFNGLPQIGFEPYLSNGRLTMARIPAAEIGATEAEEGGVILRGINAGAPAPLMSQINALSNNDLNKLITLENVEFSRGSDRVPYADSAGPSSVNHTLVDCDGYEIIVRSSGFATFADELTPEGNGSITGVYGVFGDDRQLLIRDLSDVDFPNDRCDGSGTGGGPGTGTGGGDDEPYPGDPVFTSDFQNFADRANVELPGWTHIAAKSTRYFIAKEFDGNIYAQATAFGDNDNPETEIWMISPSINTTERTTMSFRSAMAFYEHNGLEVLYSTDYNGDYTAADWENINVTLAGQNQDNYDWVPSGEIDLTGFGSEIRIAFKYSGTSSQNTTSYIIDDLQID